MYEKGKRGIKWRITRMSREENKGHGKKEPAHTHQHRALIGFDEHGIPTVVAESDHNQEGDFTKDYMQAVAEYRKTFPDKQKVLEETPDPAVREEIKRYNQNLF